MFRMSPRATRNTLPALALALALGAAPLRAGLPQVPPTQLAAIRAQQPQRVAQAASHLMALRDQLGLGAAAGFVAHHPFTDPHGRTVTRFHQTHAGFRVWGGEAIVHTEAEGQVNALTQGVKTGLTLPEGAPRLSADQARAIAMKHLAPKGVTTAEAKVERVAFPTHFTGGLATRYDATKGATVVDLATSTWAKQPAEPFVWAYEVRTLLNNRKDGHKEMSYIIDATTGAVLRKWDEVQRLTADDTPVQGTGHSHYRGTVPLDTVQTGDGTYSLVAKNRGHLPQPYFQEAGITQVGLTTCYGTWYPNLGPDAAGFEIYSGNLTNEWGNGTIMPFPWNMQTGGMYFDYNGDGSIAWMKDARAASGETAAVDAHYGLSTTWDFYQNVFGRDGIDDLGTSTFAVVHYIDTNPYWGTAPLPDNAFWAPWYFGMNFGTGFYPADPNYGMMSEVTELDITGHELTHGVTQETAHLIYDAQSGGMNEATSDIMGKMVQAYADGGATGATIPEFAPGDLTPWEVGRNSVRPELGALRFMYKPSKDGISVDEWYDGIDDIDVHFSSGPVNRFFFFLATGASSNASSETYSAYLPGGMTGLGNEKAARIWYRTLTQHLVPDSDFESARAASILAAGELYGQPEVDAVKKAWAAVNVGAAPGQPEPVRLSFPVMFAEGSFIDNNAVPSGILGRVQLFPTRTAVRIAVNVANTTNKAVTLSQPMWHGYMPAGTMAADGTWTTPNFHFYMELLGVSATSQADSRQYAKTNVLLCDLDSDQDTDIDAIDLGSTAMAWGPFAAPHPSARTAGSGDDWDLAFFTAAFQNGFPTK
ncbi:MAG TPA: M4 family metallopeptidase [Holophagaceae bacterium]|nr:M4 family metallopeptidase [Holophagaceae bacterium]